MSLRSRLSLLLVAACVWSVPCLAGDEAAARTLFKDGNDLVKKGDFVTALDKFRSAYAQWNNPKILLNIATTLRALGRYAEAVETYERYLLDPGADANRKNEVTAALKEIEGKTGRVRIVVSESDALLNIDGRRLDKGQTTARVDPGRHAVTAEKDGFVAAAATVESLAGHDQEVSLKMLRAVAEQPAVTPTTAPTQTAPPPSTSGGSSALRISSYVAGGVGIAGLATFAIAGSMARSKFNSLTDECQGPCPSSRQSDVDAGRREQTLANVGFVVGLVGLGTGATLFLLSRPSKSPAASASAGRPVLQVAAGPTWISVHGVLP
jgi:hypothetical protein